MEPKISHWGTLLCYRVPLYSPTYACCAYCSVVPQCTNSLLYTIHATSTLLTYTQCHSIVVTCILHVPGVPHKPKNYRSQHLPPRCKASSRREPHNCTEARWGGRCPKGYTLPSTLEASPRCLRRITSGRSICSCSNTTNVCQLDSWAHDE